MTSEKVINASDTLKDSILSHKFYLTTGVTTRSNLVWYVRYIDTIS